MPADRTRTVSSFTIVKGALVQETYATFAGWDLDRPKKANLERLRRTNYVGAKSASWLRDVAFVVSRRFDPDGRDRALVRLAQAGCPIESWKPVLLWHITRDEFLLRDFLINWLFPAFDGGTGRIGPDDVVPHLATVAQRGGRTEHAWSDHTTRRVAAGLLKIATDFGLLRGSISREFAPHQLPQRSFLYILHAMLEAQPNARLVVESPDWRMFLLRPRDVEAELLRLHQLRELEYQVAGSLAQLKLPCASAAEYAVRWIA